MRHFEADHFASGYLSARHLVGTPEVVGSPGSGFFGQHHFRARHFRPKHFAVAQLAVLRPVADDAANGWTAVPGPVLYEAIDEGSANPADYIFTESPGFTLVRFRLDARTPYDQFDDFVLSYELEVSRSAQVAVMLLTGQTRVAAWLHTGPLPLTTWVRQLNSAQKAMIQPYADLFLQFESMPIGTPTDV